MIRSTSRLLWLIVPALTYVGVLAFVSIKDPGNLQNWAVALTGLVVIWYTWETRELRIASYVQLETQVRPYVVLQPQTGVFQVTNFGNGVALHTHLDPVVISVEEQIEIRFPNAVAVLRPWESAAIEARSYRAGKDVGDFFNAHLDPRYANERLPVTLRFENVQLKGYSTTQQVSPGQIVVVRTD